MNLVDGAAKHAKDFARNQLRELAIAVALWLLAFVLLGIALGFAALAAFAALDPTYGPVIAASSVGGGALLLSLLVGHVALRRVQGSPREEPQKAEPVNPRSAPDESLPLLIGAGFLSGFVQGDPKKSRHR
ncbi:hypothetical protein PGB28_05165 [Primorskyibacter aestuariivivens]|uniref:hypothetical protein n=1 Tax=Primorskyibacter aestuariivivens TaxID=1888912 RepID=UPI00230182BB|nr:hypothetical protein [Primorskyibacter aestuariivivens]MDA7427840.1 hypothetical protein [Primorskyibacter aestuariivivens]